MSDGCCWRYRSENYDSLDFGLWWVAAVVAAAVEEEAAAATVEAAEDSEIAAAAAADLEDASSDLAACHPWASCYPSKIEKNRNKVNFCMIKKKGAKIASLPGLGVDPAFAFGYPDY